MEFEDKIVLEGCRKGYCEYDPATGILCWVHTVLGESSLTKLCWKVVGKGIMSMTPL